MKYQMIPASTLNTKVQGKYFQMSLKKKSTIEDAVHCHSKFKCKYKSYMCDKFSQLRVSFICNGVPSLVVVFGFPLDLPQSQFLFVFSPFMRLYSPLIYMKRNMTYLTAKHPPSFFRWSEEEGLSSCLFALWRLLYLDWIL